MGISALEEYPRYQNHCNEAKCAYSPIAESTIAISMSACPGFDYQQYDYVCYVFC